MVHKYFTTMHPASKALIVNQVLSRQSLSLQCPQFSTKWLPHHVKHKSSTVRRFDEIPGPKALPLVGNIWRYLPLIGEFNTDRFDKNAEILLKRFGTLVREVIIHDNVVLHLFDPNDMEAVFRSEGQYPQRKSHRALNKYRLDRPTTYNSGGLFPTIGEEWARLRRPFQKPLLDVEIVNSFTESFSAITEELVERIRETRNAENEVEDFLKYLFKWSLEGTGLFTLNTKLGALSSCASQDVEDLITAANCTNEAVMLTEQGSSIWRWFPTKDYRMLCASQDKMASIVGKHFDLALLNPTSSQGPLEQFLSAPGVDRKDIFTVILDLFLAGIDTTSVSCGFLLYNLAKNPQVQERLREEVFHFLPTKDTPLSPEKINKMRYLRACVKENMRLSPVSIGVGRTLTRDIELQEYNIPEGTKIVTHNQVACRQPENFRDPLAFRPERWIVGSPYFAKSHPFLVLPFGYGPRSCIGRRFAEKEIYIFLAKMMRNFRIEYKYEDIDIINRLINVPNKPLRFRFTDIDRCS